MLWSERLGLGKAVDFLQHVVVTSDRQVHAQQKAEQHPVRKGVLCVLVACQRNWVEVGIVHILLAHGVGQCGAVNHTLPLDDHEARRLVVAMHVS